MDCKILENISKYKKLHISSKVAGANKPVVFVFFHTPSRLVELALTGERLDTIF